MNAVTTHESSSGFGSTAAYANLTASDRVGISGLDDAQWKTLVRMLDERKLTSGDRLSGTYFLESWNRLRSFQPHDWKYRFLD